LKRQLLGRIGVNVVLWVLQIILAVAFLFAGGMKATQPREKLLKQMAYVEDFPQSTIKLIGSLEILGAAGLILPAATGIATWLTPLAAVCLAVTMVGAVVVHLRRKETNQIGMPIVLGIIAVVIAWGRFGPYSF
jgi:uncharacterized membrane protein YphA (DoxX/SURF4 family)